MRRLSLKQKNFAKEYVKNNGNATEAVVKSYNIIKRGTAQSVGTENLSKPVIKEEIADILNSESLSKRDISKSIKANMTIGQGVKATASDSLRAAELLLKLHGAFPSSKSTHLNIDITERYKDNTYHEILDELKTTRATTDRLLSDLGTT